MEQNSLCYTVRPCWLSIFNITVCTCVTDFSTLHNTNKRHALISFLIYSLSTPLELKFLRIGFLVVLFTVVSLASETGHGSKCF